MKMGKKPNPKPPQMGKKPKPKPLFFVHRTVDTPAALRRCSGGECKGPAQGGKQVGRIETQNAPLVRWVGGKTMPPSFRWPTSELRRP
ncbi:hypothetical protein LR48_Vigan08g014900 [Vigna angularis]|uniref:Uncharacterized protein n=1 Tax=Phaseolus angularis TaxID=3914 RepID=A0A0L9V329_PHAAN|nr:hypothetical protein LR48_Vigan08g014900 [Vigna angularis]